MVRQKILRIDMNVSARGRARLAIFSRHRQRQARGSRASGQLCGLLFLGCFWAACTGNTPRDAGGGQERGTAQASLSPGWHLFSTTTTTTKSRYEAISPSRRVFFLAHHLYDPGAQQPQSRFHAVEHLDTDQTYWAYVSDRESPPPQTLQPPEAARAFARNEYLIQPSRPTVAAAHQLHVVFRWDTDTETKHPVPVDAILLPGEAYWVQTSRPCAAELSETQGTAAQVTSCVLVEGEHEDALASNSAPNPTSRSNTHTPRPPQDLYGWLANGKIQLRWRSPSHFVHGQKLPDNPQLLFRVYRDGTAIAEEEAHTHHSPALKVDRAHRYHTTTVFQDPHGQAHESPPSDVIVLGRDSENSATLRGRFERPSHVTDGSQRASLPKLAISKVGGSELTHLAYVVKGHDEKPSEVRYAWNKAYALGGHWTEAKLPAAIVPKTEIIADLAVTAFGSTVIIGWIEQAKGGGNSRIRIVSLEDRHAFVDDTATFVSKLTLREGAAWKRDLHMAFDLNGTHHMIWNESNKVYYHRDFAGEFDERGGLLNVFDLKKRRVNHELVKYAHTASCEDGTPCCTYRYEATHTLATESKDGLACQGASACDGHVGPYLERTEETYVENPSLHVGVDRISIVARQTRMFDNLPVPNFEWRGLQESFLGPSVPPPSWSECGGGSWFFGGTKQFRKGFRHAERLHQYACSAPIPENHQALTELALDYQNIQDYGTHRSRYYDYDGARGHPADWYQYRYAGRWHEGDKIKVAQRPLQSNAWSVLKTERRWSPTIDSDRGTRVVLVAADEKVEHGFRIGAWQRTALDEHPPKEDEGAPFRTERARFEDTLLQWQISTVDAFECERSGEFHACGAPSPNPARGPVEPSHATWTQVPGSPDRMFVAYEKGTPSNPSAMGHNPIYLAQSKDGGQSWNLSSDPIAQGSMPSLGVLNEGKLTVLYHQPDPAHSLMNSMPFGQIMVADADIEPKDVAFVHRRLDKDHLPQVDQGGTRQGVPVLLTHQDMWIAAFVTEGNGSGIHDRVTVTRASSPAVEQKRVRVTLPSQVTQGQSFAVEVECVNQFQMLTTGCSVGSETQPLRAPPSAHATPPTPVVSRSPNPAPHGGGGGGTETASLEKTPSANPTGPRDRNAILPGGKVGAALASLAELDQDPLDGRRTLWLPGIDGTDGLVSVGQMATDSTTLHTNVTVVAGNVHGNYQKAKVLRDRLFKPGLGVQLEYGEDKSNDENAMDTPYLSQLDRVWAYTQGIALAQFAREHDARATDLATFLCEVAVRGEDQDGKIIKGWPFSWNTKDDTWKDARLVTGANAWVLHGIGAYLSSRMARELPAADYRKIQSCYLEGLSGLSKHRAGNLASTPLAGWLMTAGTTASGLKYADNLGAMLNLNDERVGLADGDPMDRSWAYYDILDVIGYETLRVDEPPSINTFYRDANGNERASTRRPFRFQEDTAWVFDVLKQEARAENVVTEHNLDTLSVLNHAVREWDQITRGLPSEVLDRVGGLDEIVRWRDKLREAIFELLWDESKGRVVTGGHFVDSTFQAANLSAIDNCSWLSLSVDYADLPKTYHDKLARCLHYTVDRFTSDQLAFSGNTYFGAFYFPNNFKDPYVNQSDQQEELYHLEATTGLILGLLYFADALTHTHPVDADAFRFQATRLWVDMQRFVRDNGQDGFPYSSVRIPHLMTRLPSSTAAIWFIDVYDYYQSKVQNPRDFLGVNTEAMLDLGGSSDLPSQETLDARLQALYVSTLHELLRTEPQYHTFDAPLRKLVAIDFMIEALKASTPRHEWLRRHQENFELGLRRIQHQLGAFCEAEVPQLRGALSGRAFEAHLGQDCASVSKRFRHAWHRRSGGGGVDELLLVLERPSSAFDLLPLAASVLAPDSAVATDAATPPPNASAAAPTFLGTYNPDEQQAAIDPVLWAQLAQLGQKIGAPALGPYVSNLLIQLGVPSAVAGQVTVDVLGVEDNFTIIGAGIPFEPPAGCEVVSSLPMAGLSGQEPAHIALAALGTWPPPPPLMAQNWFIALGASEATVCRAPLSWQQMLSLDRPRGAIVIIGGGAPVPNGEGAVRSWSYAAQHWTVVVNTQVLSLNRLKAIEMVCEEGGRRYTYWASNNAEAWGTDYDHLERIPLEADPLLVRTPAGHPMPKIKARCCVDLIDINDHRYRDPSSCHDMKPWPRGMKYAANVFGGYGPTGRQVVINASVLHEGVFDLDRDYVLYVWKGSLLDDKNKAFEELQQGPGAEGYVHEALWDGVGQISWDIELQEDHQVQVYYYQIIKQSRFPDELHDELIDVGMIKVIPSRDHRGYPHGVKVDEVYHFETESAPSTFGSDLNALALTQSELPSHFTSELQRADAHATDVTDTYSAALATLLKNVTASMQSDELKATKGEHAQARVYALRGVVRSPGRMLIGAFRELVKADPWLAAAAVPVVLPLAATSEIDAGLTTMVAFREAPSPAWTEVGSIAADEVLKEIELTNHGVSIGLYYNDETVIRASRTYQTSAGVSRVFDADKIYGFDTGHLPDLVPGLNQIPKDQFFGLPIPDSPEVLGQIGRVKVFVLDTDQPREAIVDTFLRHHLWWQNFLEIAAYIPDETFRNGMLQSVRGLILGGFFDVNAAERASGHSIKPTWDNGTPPWWRDAAGYSSLHEKNTAATTPLGSGSTEDSTDQGLTTAPANTTPSAAPSTSDVPVTYRFSGSEVYRSAHPLTDPDQVKAADEVLGGKTMLQFYVPQGGKTGGDLYMAFSSRKTVSFPSRAPREKIMLVGVVPGGRNREVAQRAFDLIQTINPTQSAIRLVLKDRVDIYTSASGRLQKVGTQSHSNNPHQALLAAENQYRTDGLPDQAETSSSNTNHRESKKAETTEFEALSFEERKTAILEFTREELKKVPAPHWFRIEGTDGRVNEHPVLTVIVVDRFKRKPQETVAHGHEMTAWLRDQLRIWGQYQGVNPADVGIVGIEADSFPVIPRAMEVIAKLHDDGEPILTASLSLRFWVPGTFEGISLLTSRAATEAQAEILQEYISLMGSRRMVTVTGAPNVSGYEQDALGLVAAKDPSLLLFTGTESIISLPPSKVSVRPLANVGESIHGAAPSISVYTEGTGLPTLTRGNSVVPPVVVGSMAAAALRLNKNGIKVTGSDLAAAVLASMEKHGRAASLGVPAVFFPSRFHGLVNGAASAMQPTSSFPSAVEHLIAHEDISDLPRTGTVRVNEAFVIRLHDGQEVFPISLGAPQNLRSSHAVLLLYKRRVVDIVPSEEWSDGRASGHIQVESAEVGQEYLVHFLTEQN